MKRKLTNRDKADAYFMRLNGMSLQEIADKFGVTRQCIAQLLPASSPSFRHPTNADKCIYPAIREYMQKNRMTYSRMASLCGVTSMTIYNCLTGEVTPTKKTIDRVLEVTQMTYEEAFKKETIPRALEGGAQNV